MRPQLDFINLFKHFALLCIILYVSAAAFSPITSALSIGNHDYSLRYTGVAPAESSSVSVTGLHKRETGVSYPAYTKITVEGSVFAVLMILTGLVICFFGHRLLKVTLFFAGFYLGSLIGYSILNNVNNSLPLWGQLLIIIAFGLVFALLASFLFKLGLALLGALFGISIALFINSWRSGGLIKSDWGIILFLCLMAIAGAILILYLQYPLIILATAVLGAFLTMMGIDFFARTGYVQNMGVIFSGSNQLVYFDSDVAAMLGVQVALTVIGLVFQYVQRYHRGKGAEKY